VQRAHPGCNARSEAPGRWALTVIGLGIGLRLFLLLERSPLWVDEAMVAVGVLRRSWGQLLHPPDYGQVVPPLYLLLLKGSTAVFGHGEVALRLPALVAGVLTLLLLFRVATDLAGSRTALATLVLAGCSVALLRFSVEVKAYAFDAFFGALIPFLVIRLETGVGVPRRLVALSVTGMVLGSVAAPVLVGGLLAAIAGSEPARRRVGWTAMTAVALWGAGLYLVLYFGMYWSSVHSPIMAAFWKDSFLTLWKPDLVGRVGGAVRAFASLLPSLAPLPAGLRLALIAAAGLFFLPRRRGVVLAIAMPSLLAITGSMLGLVPLVPRLVLFSSIPLLLCLGQSLTVLSQPARDGRRTDLLVLLVVAVISVPSLGTLSYIPPTVRLLLGALAVVALTARVPGPIRQVLPAALALLLALPQALGLARHPVVEDGRTAIHRLIAGGAPAVYIAATSTPTWLYYSSRWDGSEASRLEWYLGQSMVAGADVAAVGDSQPSASGLSRVWREGRLLEIFGTLPGVAQPSRGGVAPARYPGWSQQEAARIGAVTAGPLVVLETHALAGATNPLIAAMAAAGWQVDSTFRELTATATYFHRAR
jgi:hypothetical protein